jgi:hypothetical protein
VIFFRRRQAMLISEPQTKTDTLTRREMLRLSAAGLISWREMMMSDRLSAARAAVDHLLLGVSDLDEGIAWIEKVTGVRAVIGGSHPGRGTRNALLALGRRQYLEIIAPDPAQPQIEERFASLRRLTAPRLITWAAATKDISRVAQQAKSAGYQLAGPFDGSRARPDGKILRWKTLGVSNELGSVIPFFIQWGAGVIHPAEDSPAGGQLVSFVLQHPEPERVREMLRKLGFTAEVAGGEAGLKAVLKTPRGKVELR